MTEARSFFRFAMTLCRLDIVDITWTAHVHNMYEQTAERHYNHQKEYKVVT